MQRRATALWAVLFIVLSVGAYAMIGVAEEPALVESPDHSIANGSSVELGGQEYTFTTDDISSELTYFNESARGTETFENGSQMDYQNGTYDVAIPNATSPSSFTLRENQSLPENVSTTTVNETEYVIVEEGENRTLVEVDQYIIDRFGPPQTESFSEGDQIQYGGNASDVANVSSEAVLLAWDAPQNQSITVEEGDRLTFDGTEYVAHYPDANTLSLSSDVQGYENQLDVRDTYTERINGLWGAVIIGVLGAVTLLGLAYMPSRY